MAGTVESAPRAAPAAAVGGCAATAVLAGKAVLARPRWTALALAMAGAGESVVPPGSSVREARVAPAGSVG
ncbi:hypothetical protein MPS_4479 [Mycobacterium pseudoshottsii JCM 15466]|nr:hypothetical protein MPS_4479 [Mycobacterium pseudoshottsii JCM 15466]